LSAVEDKTLLKNIKSLSIICILTILTDNGVFWIHMHLCDRICCISIALYITSLMMDV